MKALCLAVAAATTLATSLASAQAPHANGEPAPPPPQASAGTSGPLPALPSAAPSDSSAPSAVVAPVPSPAPPASTVAEAPRGGRGESCRARSDCNTGLACLDDVCALPSDGKSCSADSECGDLACVNGVCAAHAKDASTMTRKLTLDLDETFISRSRVIYDDGAHDVTPRDGTETTLSSIFGARYHTGALELEAALPFALQTLTAHDPHVAAGNVAISAYYVNESRGTRYRVGGGVALPTAGTSTDSESASTSAAMSRGLDRVWLWAPHIVAFTPSVLIGSTREGVFQHASELVIAPVVFTAGSYGSPLLVLQASEDIGAHVGLARVGVRGEIVAMTGKQTQTQLSLLPYAGIDGEEGFADLGLLVNLGAPAGFSFDDTKFWGLRLRGGMRF